MNVPNPPDEGKVPESPQPVPPAAPAPTLKLKTDVGMFILGLAIPFVVGGIVIALANLPGTGFQMFGIAVPWVLMLMFFGMLYFLIAGKKAGNAKLHSFGKGGLWAFAAIPLFLLLAFGTCLVGGFGG